MLKKCLAYLALSALLVHADAAAECPCKQKNQPRQQRQRRQRRQRQQNMPQQMPQRQSARSQQPQGSNQPFVNMLDEGEERPIIYSIVDHPPKSAAPVKQTPAPKPAPAPAAPAPAPVAKPAATEDKVIYPQSPKELDRLVAENALVIVNIGTEWCGPCKAFMGPYKESAQANPGIVHIKADADRLRGSKHIQGVNAYPTIKFFKHGKLQETCQGTSRFAALCKSLKPTETVPSSAAPSK